MSRAAAIRAQIEEISADEKLQNDLKILPANYNFEVPKTIWKIRTTNSSYVALQFPEGLLMYACVIADILQKYTGCDTLIMGDVTYGACCVDDFTARGLGCDLLVHYGHSCLVPIQDTQGIHMLYIFVNIDMNLSHFIDIVRANFPSEDSKIALVSTVQFVVSLQVVKTTLEKEGYNIIIPQCKPLSPGEILGCTSPRIAKDVTALIYLGDGRFHLESAMIHNPELPAFQYDPYSRKLTRESYDFKKMTSNRGRAVEIAKEAKTFGLIQGTLGRQGNSRIVEELESKLTAAGKSFVRVLMSEIFPYKLEMFADVDCWVQVACPRLSIDWGEAYKKPLLTPYELSAALDQVPFRADYYPMDFYSNDSLGPWTNNHEKHRPKRVAPRRHIVVAAE
uniref:2-(3-amino-3-carboxypropyl)histidine synthase subunit 1 n=1 Tax=Steinernema glaseri TaxID=37863 RepID=A0A1I7ZGE5_9BILA